MLGAASGHPAIDCYLAHSYERVRGMSSRFAAAICGYLIRRQSALGIGGELVEIGIFEGRFRANCAAHGVAPERYLSWKADSREISSAALREKLGGRPVRFVHIDSHHSRECLINDLELVAPALHRDAIICLDDMLHPGYPMMTSAVLDYFARHPQMRLLCVVDREDIVAAAKFLICRAESLALYEQDLLNAFSRFHFALNADMETYFALVLTPRPRLAEVR